MYHSQSQNPYALKPVLSSQTSIRPSQTKTVEKIDTAATYFQIITFNVFNFLANFT